VSFLPYVILIALCGLVVGALARQLLPGRDPIGIVETILIGIAGSLLAGLIGWYAVHSRVAGFVLAALVTAGLVYLVRGARLRSGEAARR
jgi:uncharacterized membrane protein YeaQ/YmgE (transglycosylase-associated protein family)